MLQVGWLFCQWGRISHTRATFRIPLRDDFGLALIATGPAKAKQVNACGHWLKIKGRLYIIVQALQTQVTMVILNGMTAKADQIGMGLGVGVVVGMICAQTDFNDRAELLECFERVVDCGPTNFRVGGQLRPCRPVRALDADLYGPDIRKLPDVVT